jgi:hypothetical protein
MSRTNRTIMAATLIGGAIALPLYVQSLSLPVHFS